VRKAKSEAKTSMRTEVAEAGITGPEAAIARVREAADDLKAAGRIADLRFATSEQPLSVTVTLARTPTFSREGERPRCGDGWPHERGDDGIRRSSRSRTPPCP
jgi:hypothetical protein